MLGGKKVGSMLYAYGKLFERALYTRGTDRDELIEMLSSVTHTQG